MIDTKTIAGIQIKRPRDVAMQNGVVITLAGPPNVGKTTMSGYLAEDEITSPVGWIDCEAGAISIAHRDDINLFEAEKWGDADKLVTAFVKTCSYKSLVLDNLSALLDMRLDMMTTGLPSWNDHYRQATHDIIYMVHQLQTIARKHGTNVIISGWVEDRKDDKGNVIRTTIALNPKTQLRFAGTVDALAHMEFTANPDVRLLNFQSGKRTDAKLRRAKFDGAPQIPLQIAHRESDKVLIDLVTTMRGLRPWPADKYKVVAQPQQQKEGS